MVGAPNVSVDVPKGFETRPPKPVAVDAAVVAPKLSVGAVLVAPNAGAGVPIAGDAPKVGATAAVGCIFGAPKTVVAPKLRFGGAACEVGRPVPRPNDGLPAGATAAAGELHTFRLLCFQVEHDKHQALPIMILTWRRRKNRWQLLL